MAATASQRIGSREADVGGLPIHRVLPTRERRLIGAWCFLDHAGPSILREGQAMRVGPHPHTSLQTFTWMLSGEVHHRDSLGSDQVIRPGEVNLMTAGHGISPYRREPGGNRQPARRPAMDRPAPGQGRHRAAL